LTKEIIRKELRATPKVKPLILYNEVN